MEAPPPPPPPPPLKRTVAKVRAGYIAFEAEFNVLNPVKLDGQLGSLLGYGNGPFGADWLGRGRRMTRFWEV